MWSISCGFRECSPSPSAPWHTRTSLRPCTKAEHEHCWHVSQALTHHACVPQGMTQADLDRRAKELDEREKRLKKREEELEAAGVGLVKPNWPICR